MDSECKINVDQTQRESRERFRLCTKANVALLGFTLFLVGCAAALLLLNRSSKGPHQQDEHFEKLRRSLRQTNVRAAIHLEGKHDKDQGTVLWQKDVDQSYYQGGLVLDHNEIVIPHSGPYFVYSQASYSMVCSTNEEDEEQTSNNNMVHLSHMLERWSASYGTREEHKYQTILHSVRTACEKQPQQEGTWFSGVYVGAMFNLMQGDRLRTNMNSKTLRYLEDGHGATFFGVFAL